jgi:hypothetical protein
MSDKKIIDVEAGDTWTSKPGHAWLFQYRRWTNFRVVGERDYWVPNEVHRHAEEQDIPGHLAEELLKAWGYTITKPEQAVVCSTCRTFGCDDHVPDAGKMDPTLAATVKRLEERVAKLEAATTTAKVRVPTKPQRPTGYCTDWDRGWDAAMDALAALKAPTDFPAQEKAGKQESVDDGFGTSADKCGDDCTLQVNRPGDIRCDGSGAQCPNKEATNGKA